MSFGGIENDQVTAEFSGPSPLTELNPVMEMDTHEEIFNADVTLDVLVTQIDGDLTRDTQVKISFSLTSAIICQPSEVYVNPKGGDSLLGDMEAISKFSNSVMMPKNTSTFADGDPFLVKLQEIDRDIKKFDQDACANPGDLLASTSCLDGLVAAQGKAENEVGKPQLVGL